MNKSELLSVAKPILFNTPMVQAILDGRKTATRRIVKPQPVFKTTRKFVFNDDECPKKWEDCDNIINTYRYQVGDILYVRETWCKYSKLEDDMVTPIEGTEQYYYRADGENPTPFNTFLVQRDGYDEYSDYPKWRPSIHMPKEAARIFLRVTDVRVERLQECGKDWCIGIEKEGVTTPQSPILYINDDAFHNALREEFQKLWDSTIKKTDLDRYGWDANPFVWVIEFERLEVSE